MTAELLYTDIAPDWSDVINVPTSLKASRAARLTIPVAYPQLRIGTPAQCDRCPAELAQWRSEVNGRRAALAAGDYGPTSGLEEMSDTCSQSYWRRIRAAETALTAACRAVASAAA